MDKFLIAFLKINSTLILPGLGALTVTDEAKGDILFMPFLKHDDGRLAKFISESEGIDEQRAQVMVAQYVRDIENRLNAEGNYTIYQFGTFSKEVNGEISFLKESQEALTDGNSKTKENEVIEHKESSTNRVNSQGISDATVAEEHIPLKEEREETVETVTYSKEDQWKDDLDLPPIGYEVPKVKQPILEKAPIERKKRRPMIMAILTIVVLGVGGLLTYIVFYNTLEPVTQASKRKQTEIITTKKEDSEKLQEANEEKTPTDQSTIESESEEVQYTDNVSGGDYHVVVGAFAVQTNAERFLKRIQSTGSTSSSLHERYGLYFIHLSDFQTKELANDACKNAQADFPGAWVYYYP
jgi:nucleoid DNA-binding protein